MKYNSVFKKFLQMLKTKLIVFYNMNNKFSPWPSFTKEEAEAVQSVLLSTKLIIGQVMNVGNLKRVF